MFGYFILFILLLFIFSFENKNSLLYAFIVLTVFSAIRFGIGYDYYSYYTVCRGFGTDTELLRYELIPQFFCKLSILFEAPNLFFVLSSIFISIFYCYGILKDSNDYAISLMFYLCFPFLFMDQLGIVRQGMATSVIFCAITAFKNDFKIKLLLLIIACLCHKSAIVCLIILVPWTKIEFKYLVVLLLISIFLSYRLVPVISNLANYIDGSTSEKFLDYMTAKNIQEGRLIRYLIYFITSLLLLCYNKLKDLYENNHYYISYAILGTIMYILFVDVDATLSKRLAMYFFSITIIIIPDLCNVVNLHKSLYYTSMLALFFILVYVMGSQQIGERIEDQGLYGPKYPYRTIFQREDL